MTLFASGESQTRARLESVFDNAPSEWIGHTFWEMQHLVNAVLRRVAADLRATGGVSWPDEATRLSVPDWVLQRLVAALGGDRAVGGRGARDRPAEGGGGADGYGQDPAAQHGAAGARVAGSATPATRRRA